MSATIEVIRLGENCSACGEEMTLELANGDEFQVACGCSCAGTLCP